MLHLFLRGRHVCCFSFLTWEKRTFDSCVYLYYILGMMMMGGLGYRGMDSSGLKALLSRGTGQSCMTEKPRTLRILTGCL